MKEGRYTKEGEGKKVKEGRNEGRHRKDRWLG
jgi:hypothetical protein